MKCSWHFARNMPNSIVLIKGKAMSEKPLTNQELIDKARAGLAEDIVDPGIVYALIERLECSERKNAMLTKLLTV